MEIEKKIKKVLITVKEPQKGGKSKSMTIYDTTVEELFNFIRQKIKENGR